jgi:hypothetical protein
MICSIRAYHSMPCPKQGHATRRIETLSLPPFLTMIVVSQTRSRHKAYRNKTWLTGITFETCRSQTRSRHKAYRKIGEVYVRHGRPCRDRMCYQHRHIRVCELLSRSPREPQRPSAALPAYFRAVGRRIVNALLAERAVVILQRPVPRSGGEGLYRQDITVIMIRCHSANLVPDAHLVALAIEHGLAVVSTDTDFAKVPGVTWLNPVLAAAS